MWPGGHNLYRASSKGHTSIWSRSRSLLKREREKSGTLGVPGLRTMGRRRCPLPVFSSMACLGMWVWGAETSPSLLHHPAWGFLPPSAHACRRRGQTRSLWAGFPGRRSLPACTDGALSSSPLPHAVCRARVTTRTQVTMGMTQIKCKCHGELRHPFIDHSL